MARAETTRAERAKKGVLLVVFAAGVLAACSSVDDVKFGEPDCVAGACGDKSNASSSSTTSASSSGACNVDPSCPVSFANDVFKPILDGTAGCTGSSCHATGAEKAGLRLDPGDAKGARAHLVAYMLGATPGPAGPYVVPCDPGGSRLVCNLRLADPDAGSGATCGSVMPIGAMPITTAELQTITKWIACGAPDN